MQWNEAKLRKVARNYWKLRRKLLKAGCIFQCPQHFTIFQTLETLKEIRKSEKLEHLLHFSCILCTTNEATELIMQTGSPYLNMAWMPRQQNEKQSPIAQGAPWCAGSRFSCRCTCWSGIGSLCNFGFALCGAQS